MGKNRDFVTISIARNFCTLEISNKEFKAIELNETLSRLSYESGNRVNQILDRQEAALQGIDPGDFNDDFSTAEYAKLMKKRQQIETQYQREVDAEMARVHTAEKAIERQATMVETSLKELRARKETYDEFMQSIDCSYFD
ncbi:MAG: hypothetical protein OSJ27_04665 [Candidatus Gastranaerophilales bacterium]|nr:hypothetical protein [Candidatus Gastranaerophilales bacterium]